MVVHLLFIDKVFNPRSYSSCVFKPRRRWGLFSSLILIPVDVEMFIWVLSCFVVIHSLTVIHFDSLSFILIFLLFVLIRQLCSSLEGEGLASLDSFWFLSTWVRSKWFSRNRIKPQHPQTASRWLLSAIVRTAVFKAQSKLRISLFWFPLNSVDVVIFLFSSRMAFYSWSVGMVFLFYPFCYGKLCSGLEEGEDSSLLIYFDSCRCW